MNSVSWFVYLSDVIPNFSVIGWILLVLSALLFFMLPKEGVEIFSHDHDPMQGLVRKESYITLVIAIILVLFTPSKNTIYAIAASQVGEQIIQLEEVQEVGGEVGGLAKDAINLLRQNIQEQLTEGRGEASSKPVEASK